MGFGRSSTAEFPSSWVTGKRRNDANIEASVIAKTGVAVTSQSRWGDYTGIDMDNSASNNGISALVDAKGREIARLGLNVAGTLDFKLPATLRPTPYARFGDEIFLWLVVLLAIGVAVRASHHVANNDRR